MSAITVGCMQTYKGSVQRTLHEVDSNIKVTTNVTDGVLQNDYRLCAHSLQSTDFSIYLVVNVYFYGPMRGA